MDEILAMEADAVLYAPLIPNRDEVAAILRSGKNVVTPVGWFYPTERDGAPLAAACAEGGTTLHGTGINPGGITELHPLMFSALSSAVTFVRGEEFSDIRTYNAPDVVRHIMMFGGQPEEAMGGPMLGLLSGGFIQSVRMCLDTLGFSADAEIRTSQEVAVATAPIETPIGVIEPGLVAGQRFIWEAFVGETCVVRIAVNWLMGEEHLDTGVGVRPRGRAVRGRGPGRPEHLRHDQGLAARDRRGGPGPQPRRRRDRDALRELDPVRRRRRPRHPDLPGPAAHRRPGAPRPELSRRLPGAPVRSPTADCPARCRLRSA